jgi:GWxTD domain-containing protein
MSLFLIQIQGVAKNIKALVSYSTFCIPGESPYFELHLAVDGNSLEYKTNASGSFEATMEITMLFLQADSIVAFDKYEFKSPAATDTAVHLPSFINTQRISLSNGEYKLDMSIRDVNSMVENTIRLSETFVIDFPENELSLSDIQLVEKYSKTEKETSYSKYGLDIIPMIYAFYPESVNTLTFYIEMYNALQLFGSEEQFLMTYFVETFESKKRLNDFAGFRRVKTDRDLNVFVTTLDIANLPSGNYNIVVEVRNKSNVMLLSKQTFFQRSNPVLIEKMYEQVFADLPNTFAGYIENADTLREYLRMIVPKATETERQYAMGLVNEGTVNDMQQFFYTFWFSRNQIDPEEEWRKYCYEVYKVNTLYKTPNRKGYNTDRGRVYLQYGAPDQISENYHEPEAYPYEIWHYYTLGKQRNKKFVFYTRDMATNEFVLIHSDALGELSDTNWDSILYGRSMGGSSKSGGIDIGSPFGSKASEQWISPR